MPTIAPLFPLLSRSPTRSRHTLWVSTSLLSIRLLHMRSSPPSRSVKAMVMGKRQGPSSRPPRRRILGACVQNRPSLLILQNRPRRQQPRPSRLVATRASPTLADSTSGSLRVCRRSLLSRPSRRPQIRATTMTRPSYNLNRLRLRRQAYLLIIRVHHRRTWPQTPRRHPTCQTRSRQTISQAVTIPRAASACQERAICWRPFPC